MLLLLLLSHHSQLPINLEIQETLLVARQLTLQFLLCQRLQLFLCHRVHVYLVQALSHRRGDHLVAWALRLETAQAREVAGWVGAAGSADAGLLLSCKR